MGGAETLSALRTYLVDPENEPLTPLRGSSSYLVDSDWPELYLAALPIAMERGIELNELALRACRNRGLSAQPPIDVEGRLSNELWIAHRSPAALREHHKCLRMLESAKDVGVIGDADVQDFSLAAVVEGLCIAGALLTTAAGTSSIARHPKQLYIPAVDAAYAVAFCAASGLAVETVRTWFDRLCRRPSALYEALDERSRARRKHV